MLVHKDVLCTYLTLCVEQWWFLVQQVAYCGHTPPSAGRHQRGNPNLHFFAGILMLSVACPGHCPPYEHLKCLMGTMKTHYIWSASWELWTFEVPYGNYEMKCLMGTIKTHYIWSALWELWKHYIWSDIQMCSVWLQHLHDFQVTFLRADVYCSCTILQLQCQ
jgi:hypothetical protein